MNAPRVKLDEESIVYRVKNATDLAGIHAAISTIDTESLSTRATLVVSDQIKRLGISPDERLALLSNFTLDMLAPSIVTSLAASHSVGACYVGSFNQHYQEILDGSSELHKFKPDTVVLALSIKALAPDIYYRFSELGREQREALAEEVVDHVIDWIEMAKKSLTANLLICNFIPPIRPQLGIADNAEPETEIEFYQKLNKTLRTRINKLARASLLDVASLALGVGWHQIYDPKFHYLAKMQWSNEFLQTLSQEIVKYLVALKGQSKKCLVLDLDNTLWGGILGEDGVSGIKAGAGDPVSEAFYDFQFYLKSLKHRGIILALCSKNNYEDVEEAFRVREEMPLCLNDFASVRINWNMKNQSLVEIAEELNIGLDSMVFVDDNPAEVSLIEQTLPEVASLKLPELPEEIPSFLQGFPYFEKLSVLEADRSKTRQYLDNKRRSEHRSRAASLDDYLKSLETRVELRRATGDDLPRLHQLFTKTNQFNLTTIRYSTDEIEGFITGDRYDLFCFSLEDKFGNLGSIGLILTEADKATVKIDSFVLSCRAMGRSVEVAVLNWIKEYYFGIRDFSEIRAIYFPTRKNKPVENFYAEQGFETLAEDSSKTEYRLDKGSSKRSECSWIELITRD